MLARLVARFTLYPTTSYITEQYEIIEKSKQICFMFALYNTATDTQLRTSLI